MNDFTFFSQLRGPSKANRPLADLSWLKTGGAADYFFQPADHDDLAAFLEACPKHVPILPMGVGSNIIFRDGGVEGVVLRLGRAFMGFEPLDENRIYVGAGLLDAMVARKAASLGIDFGFLRTIPGAIGGAVAMNAGCYGRYMADIVESIDILTREGQSQKIKGEDAGFSYRYSALPEGTIVVGATLFGERGEPAEIEAAMNAALEKRAKTQPVNERSCGSTFRNPAGFSSTGKSDDSHELKAWSVIDAAGLRGARLGGAQMSEMHPNFLINTGNASAYDLEALGETVRKKVKVYSGHELTWEIKRLGRFAKGQEPDWV